MECAAGGPLDRDLEELIAAFGSGLLVLLAIWLVTHDLEALGAYWFRQQAVQGGPAAAAALLPRP